MATRSHTSSKKRQKEIARMEKQKEKTARRMQRKMEKHAPGDGGADEEVLAEPAVPLTDATGQTD